MVNIETKLSGDMVVGLENFEAKIKESVIFSGAAAMAKVLYDEARANAPMTDKEHYFYGRNKKKYLFQPGTLKASIYRVYSKEKSSAEEKTYRISWNHQKAPYGFMVEFGTSRAAAHPFMRKAFDRIQDAISVGKERMAERLAGGVE